MVKKALIIAVAVVAIVAAVYVIARRSGIASKPELSKKDAMWVLLTMGGWYECPHCGKKVTLTDEQMRMPQPPDLVCTHCKKPVDITQLGKSDPAKDKKP